MPKKIIKLADLQTVISTLILANCLAFTKEGGLDCEDEYQSLEDEYQDLLDHIEKARDIPVFFIMRDKQEKMAVKELANFGYNAWLGAIDNKDYRGARKHVTDTMNGIWQLLAGKEVVDIILDEMKPVFLMLKSFDDLDSPKIELLIASTSHSIKKELLLKGLYNGPLL